MFCLIDISSINLIRSLANPNLQLQDLAELVTMGVVQRKLKKILSLKALERWILKGAISKEQKVPIGCFSVYVGAERQRFVVKTEFVNHPLFKILLDEAEVEYGFNSDGPIWLPCKVDLFYKVLAEILDEEYDKEVMIIAKAKGSSFFFLQSPACLLSSMSKDHRGYSVMDSEMLKINSFQ